MTGIVRCGVDPARVQIVIPSNAKSKLQDLIERFGASVRMLEPLIGCSDGEFPTYYVDYNTPEFKRLTGLRFLIIRELLKENERIVHADVDIAWLRNPLPYLTEVLCRYPWACQTEAVANFPPEFCVGFYAVRSSPEAFDLIDRLVAEYSRDPIDLNDQELFNQTVRADPRHLASIFPLPEALFANGLLYRAFNTTAKDELVMAGELKPFIFHGNWTIGIENKRRLFKQVGAWLVGDA